VHRHRGYRQPAAAERRGQPAATCRRGTQRA
jgi:hypothetical protein